MQGNQNSLVIGANTWARRDDRPDWRRDHFSGVIEGFAVIGSQLDADEVAELSGTPAESDEEIILERSSFIEPDQISAVDEVFANLGAI